MVQQPYSAAAWNSIWRQGALCVWWGSLDHQTALVVVTHWAPSGASAATYRHLEEPGNTCMVAHTQSCPHACRARVNTTCRTAALDVIGTSAGSSCWSSSGRPQGARSRLAGCLASPLTMHQIRCSVVFMQFCRHYAPASDPSEKQKRQHLGKISPSGSSNSTTTTAPEMKRSAIRGEAAALYGAAKSQFWSRRSLIQSSQR